MQWPCRKIQRFIKTYSDWRFSYLLFIHRTYNVTVSSIFMIMTMSKRRMRPVCRGWFTWPHLNLFKCQCLLCFGFVFRCMDFLRRLTICYCNFFKIQTTRCLIQISNFNIRNNQYSIRQDRKGLVSCLLLHLFSRLLYTTTTINKRIVCCQASMLAFHTSRNKK